MPDARFFTPTKAFSLKELQAISQATAIANTNDENITLQTVAPISVADSTSVTFLDNKRYRDQLKTSQAGACILREEDQVFAPPHMPLLFSPHPYKAYALVAQAFYPEQKPDHSIHPQAIVDPRAKIGSRCAIDAGAVIEAGAEIGADCHIGAHAVIGRNVVLGNGCQISAGCVVSHALLGQHVVLYPGVKIGQAGFGFAIDAAGPVSVPQLGRVLIGDYSEIGANTTIDRGAGPDTVIGRHVRIDNLVQLGHNVEIADGCVIVAQVGISGSTKIGRGTLVGGQAGLTGHLTVGSNVQIAAGSGVMQDVADGQIMGGSPAMPLRDMLKITALLKRMVKKS